MSFFESFKKSVDVLKEVDEYVAGKNLPVETLRYVRERQKMGYFAVTKEGAYFISSQATTWMNCGETEKIRDVTFTLRKLDENNEFAAEEKIYMQICRYNFSSGKDRAVYLSKDKEGWFDIRLNKNNELVRMGRKLLLWDREHNPLSRNYLCTAALVRNERQNSL